MSFLRLAAAATVAFLALFGPATAAFAAEPPSTPYVTATAVGDHTVRVDWYLDDNAPRIEIATYDSAGASAVHTVDATAGSVTFTDLPGGSWRADVTAIDGSQRSETVSVNAQVTAPAPAPTPTPIPTQTIAPPTTSAATVDFSIVPGPDGTIDQAQVRVRATGLAPESTLAIALDGNPLGTGTPLPDGTVDQLFPLPAGLATGAHKLDVTAVDAQDIPITSSYSFDVAAPEPAVSPSPEEDERPAAPSVLEASGDEAVPYLVAGTVAATVATGAAAAAASTMTTRVRRLRVSRLLDAEFSGAGHAGSPHGVKSFFSDFVASLRGPR